MKAYPLVYKDQYSGEQKIEHGMDLRDYFAAKAMQAYVQTKEVNIAISDGQTNSKKICDAAYDWADAMLEARDK